ncbi:MAG: PH domain-containing protein [archaeon]|nr:PH domain-containing protein [archaeon]MDA0842373.1 PH domain-containing protein [archaeon]MDA1168531.1 PH domain-containing protein [archaeon]
MTDEDTPVVEQSIETSETASSSKNDALAKKFRLVPGEELLLSKQPSPIAFLNMYFLGAFVLGLHFLFSIAEDYNASDDANAFLKFAIFFNDLISTDTMPLGFVFCMLIVTWLNRLINIQTSGRWVTMWLLLVTFSPLIIQIDKLYATIMGLFGNDVDPFIGFEYNLVLFGVAYSALFFALTFYFHRSFQYAITSESVIFQHGFLLSRSHRRILFDRISEIMVDRTPMGTILGYATLTVLTDSGIGLVDETVGAGGAGSLPGTDEKESDSAATKVGKSFLRKIFALMLYQRTIRRVQPDPKHCFYNIRNWEKAKMLLNEMHLKNSQSNMLQELKDVISNQQKK